MMKWTVLIGSRCGPIVLICHAEIQHIAWIGLVLEQYKHMVTGLLGPIGECFT